MTAQQLRNSILQQAIQGRLVPQDPNDEPANVLLEKIRKQKEQLVKEGKLKKKDLVVTPIADDEKPFDIPETWEWCRLSSIVSILGDGIHGTPSYDSNGEYFFINGNNLSNGKVVIKPDTKRCNEIEYNKYKKSLSTSTMFVSINGTIGNYAFYNGESIFLGKSACYFNLITEDFKYYLQYIIQSKYFLDYVLLKATGSTIKNVSLSAMKNLLIPLPPLAEQRRIVAKIEELMPLVEKYGKAQSELDNLNASLPSRLRQSILQEAVQGKLVPHDSTEGTGHDLLDKIKREKEELVKLGSLKKKDLLQLPIIEEEKSFDIPENWAWAKVGNIFQTYSGGTPDKGHPEYYSSNDVKWAKVGDLGSLYLSDTEEYISAAGMENSSAKLYPEQTVLVAMYCNDAIGKSSVTKSVMASNQAICGLLPNANVLPEYLYYAIQYFRPSLIEKSAGGAQKNINQKIVNDILFPLPPLAEQRRIVAKIEELFAEIDKLI